MRFFNFFLNHMVQKYQNEIAPIFYYRISTKTNEKDLKIPILQPPDWKHPYWMTLYLMLIIIVFCILCRRPALAAPGPGDRSICGILCWVCDYPFLHHGRAAAAEVMWRCTKSGIAWIRLNTAKLIWAKLVSEMELSIIIDHVFCLLWKFLTHLRQLTW